MPSPTFCRITDRTPHSLIDLGLRPVNRGPSDVPAYQPPPIIRRLAERSSACGTR